MKLGNSKFILSIFFLFFSCSSLFAEDKILSTPLINLNELKPSFEEIDNSTDDIAGSDSIKDKKEILPKNSLSSARFIGLDKITAKTFPIKIKLGETAKFGLLEIKALKCGITNTSSAKNNSVAYLQVKDISENQNEKVFIFNGWTVSSNPSLASIDHAIYDVWLVSCENA